VCSRRPFWNFYSPVLSLASTYAYNLIQYNTATSKYQAYGGLGLSGEVFAVLPLPGTERTSFSPISFAAACFPQTLVAQFLLSAATLRRLPTPPTSL